MALQKRGKFYCGESQSDIRDELTRVGKLNQYVPLTANYGDWKNECADYRKLLARI